jgi:hypothetical protein
MTAPLMPKATAVWLVENTTLTFRQIAKFCEIHELEIQAIADGDVAYNIVGLSPINNNQLTWEEIHRCEADSHADLVANVLENNVKERNAKAKKLLTPTQRSEKPAAILWILQQFPNNKIVDSQIAKLLGTTKPTIAKVRNGEYGELAPKNPMTLGLCDEVALEKAVLVSEALNSPKKKKTKKKAKKITKKVAAKKTPAKKTAAKKVAKKVATKKTTAKAATKKTPAKKAATKKVAKKVATKKATTKAAAKKTPAKKTVTKKVTKKVATKKTTTKAAAKKTPAKKAATKKVAKKVATKKITTKAAAKKTPAKKGTVKKKAAKKKVTNTITKKVSTKKTTKK